MNCLEKNLIKKLVQVIGSNRCRQVGHENVMFFSFEERNSVKNENRSTTNSPDDELSLLSKI